MQKSSFHAAKLTDRGDWIHLECENLEEWLVEQDRFFPIHPGDFFSLRVPKGTDLLALLGEGMFDGAQEADSNSLRLRDNYIPETVPVGVYDFWWDIEGHPQRIQNDESNYVRYAVIMRGDEVWQIVGLELGDRIVYALQRNWDEDFEEEPYLPELFASKRVLIDYSWHSDGPGPISWDVHRALLDMGDWLLDMQAGDSGALVRAVQLDKSLPETLVSWLDHQHGLELFVLNHAECKWRDEALREEFEEARWNFSEVAGLESSLSETEVASVLELIRASPSAAGQFLDTLERGDEGRASDLVNRMRDAAEAENATKLVGA